ncbi:hypothetical protein HDU67_003881 [Dinochytrium kinnereticum]|nr:hypothetical protein HDU67_003881 [Dinochytrium kinnereticum]
MFAELPIELVPNILGFLPFASHLTLRLASKAVHHIVCTESIHFCPHMDTLSSLAESLPQISSTIAHKIPDISSGPLERVLIVRNIATLLVTIQSFKRSLRLSVKALARIKLPLSQAYDVMAEAISARRGECEQARIISNEEPLWSSNASIIHDIYRVADYGGEAPIRMEMGKSRGASKHLSAWLRRGKVVELKFKGGGDWFVSERFSLGDAAENEEPKVTMSVSNIERVDTVDIVKEEDKAVGAGEVAARVESLCIWIIELWIRIERRDGASHDNLTARRFQYLRR